MTRLFSRIHIIHFLIILFCMCAFFGCSSGSSSSGGTSDTTPPGDVTGFTATPDDTFVTLTWTNPGDADFSGVLILRHTSAVVDSPTDGTTYAANDTIGVATVIFVGNDITFIDTGRTNGTEYHYRIFAYDGKKNYSGGAADSATPEAIDTTPPGDHDGSYTSSIIGVEPCPPAHLPRSS